MSDSALFDREGFLRDLHQWNEQLAGDIARSEGVELDAPHWEIIYLLREYYAEFDASPAMRALVNYTRLKLGRDKGKSIYLLGLFPGSPAKIGSKIAGLPKPDNCL
jgi:tRNA 2-thiouridine synthesizing protein E